MKWIKNIINKIKLHFEYKRKLKELKKKDPFLYE